MDMKKIFAFALAAVAAFSLAACSSGTASTALAEGTESAASTETAAEPNASASGEAVTIKVGASPSPHAEILEQVKPILAEQGITLEIVQFSDYVQPNTALENGELDANYFQHITYMENFNEEQGTHLVSLGSIHYEPFGIYAGKTESLDAIADGAKVAVPNDTTNEARALLLLEAQGLIKLNDGAGLNATKKDIAENPKNLDIVEMEAAQLPKSLQDVDIAVINGNYAIDAGLSVADALAVEADDSEAATAYANVIAVKEGSENNEALKALVDALKSETIQKYITDTYAGAVVPLS